MEDYKLPQINSGLYPPPTQSKPTNKSDLAFLPDIKGGDASKSRDLDSSNASMNPPLPETWTKQQLVDSESNQKTKLDWENEISRHILSLFATSNAVKNLNESKSLLDFVGSKILNPVIPDSDENNAIQSKKPGFLNQTTSSINEDEEDNQEQDNDQNYEEHKPKKVNKKKGKKKKKDSSEENESKLSKEFIGRLIEKLDQSANSSKETNKYRITNTIKARNGKLITVRGTPRCFPIWFVSNGEIYSDWRTLPGSRNIQAHLSALYEQGLFEEYLRILETTILTLWRQFSFGEEVFVLESFGHSSKSPSRATTPGLSSRAHSPSTSQRYPSASSTMLPTQELTLEKIGELWKQLIFTCLAIGIISIERKNYDKAMDYFNMADRWAKNDDVLPEKLTRKEFRAYVKDAMAYFFFKKQKSMAALAYSQQALEVFEMTNNVDHIAICLLHISAVYCQIGNFKESHKILYQFLAMLETGRLTLEIATPKQLCIVAIGYHNLAVVQLKLAMPDLACKSSQNARKIARLCLSYANRWIDIFQYTHEIAINDMKYELSSKNIDRFTPQQVLFIRELADAFFQEGV